MGVDLDLLKKFEAPQRNEWVFRATDHRSFSYMVVTYKCGCKIRTYSEAGHACPNHWTSGIKRIERVTEFY